MRRRRVRAFGSKLQTGSVGGILSRLFATVMNDLEMTEDRYTDLMQRYIDRKLTHPNRNERALARQTLSKELLRESMTWKTFLKGFDFLSIPSFDFAITLYHQNGQASTHQTTIRVRETMQEEENDFGLILTKLYHSILHDLGITTEKYNALMARFIAKAHMVSNRKEKAAARSSLSKELLKETPMTWKTFVKGVSFLNVPKFDLHLTLYAYKRTTQHKLTVALEDIDTETTEGVE